MAKDLVRTRSYVQRFIEMKANLTAVSLRMQTIKSHEVMADAMKGVTKALVAMNKKINLPGLQKLMGEFMAENERAEITQEAIGDTLDDAFETEGAAGEEDRIVNQVLDELGVGMNQSVPEAPQGGAMQKAGKEDTRVTEPVAGGGGAGPASSNNNTNGGGGAPVDAGLSDLEQRLKNLK